MKISHKISTGQFLSMLLMVVVVAFGLSKMSQIEAELEEIAKEDIPLIESLTAITTSQLEQDIAMERALRAAGLTDHNGMSSVNKLQKKFEDLNLIIVKELHNGKMLAEQGIELTHSDEARKKYKQLLQQLTQIEQEHLQYEHEVQQIFKLVKSGRKEDARHLVIKAEQEAEQLNHELEALLNDIEKFTEHSVNRAVKYEHEAINGMIAIASVSLIAGIAIGLWVSTGIKRSLNKTNQTIHNISKDFDLSLRLDESKDELGEMGKNFNEMLGHISQSMHEVSDASTQLAAASEELSAITQEAKGGLTQQKSETHQVATAMNEMSASMQEVALHSTQTADAVSNANTQTREGTLVVEQTVSAINNLATEVQKASNVIEDLSTDSDNIGSVLEVIKGIAEQTNLLALNAAIEAARAGDQGRGFAVVADEVRVLAQRTQESTAQIQQTIESLQTRAADAVAVMSESQKIAERGVAQAGEAGTSLVEISSAVTTIGDMTHQIATASEEQSAVSSDINRNITTISNAANEMSVGAEHTAKASYDIANLATKLQQSVSRFKM